ncbi:MAG: CRISPR-associated endonuclease Cas2 [Conexivisphaera sp.]
MIVVYDVSDQTRMNRLRRFLRARMSWIQNSVFEGDMSEGQLRYLMAGIEDVIGEEDSVIVYALPTDRYLERRTLGRTKGDMGFVVRCRARHGTTGYALHRVINGSTTWKCPRSPRWRV